MTAAIPPTTVTAQPGTPFTEISREFDASPARVFAAWTDPDLVVRWLGPHDLEMRIEQWSAVAGGSYRYVHTGRDGAIEAWFHGVFHEVVPDELLVQTFEFEGWPGEVSLDVLRLTDLGNGRTRLNTRSVFLSVEARDTMVESGMARGISEAYEKLDALFAG